MPAGKYTLDLNQPWYAEKGDTATFMLEIELSKDKDGLSNRQISKLAQNIMTALERQIENDSLAPGDYCTKSITLTDLTQ